MAIRFEPLELGHSEVSGFRLLGAFGRGDRQSLIKLADRCTRSRQTRLILDCHDLDSLGGSGAAVVADLQRRMQELGGELVFVAAGEVICRFLRQKFGDLPMRCFETVEKALSALAGQTAELDAEGEPDRGVGATNSGAAGLDELLEGVEPDDARPDEAVQRTADLLTAAFITTSDLLQAARHGGNSTVMGEALGMLLSSNDLAAETVYFHLHGDRYQATTGKFQLPAEGGVVAGLVRNRRPLTLLDLEEGDLGDEESRVLEEIQPDLILPLVSGDTLGGIAFLKRDGSEREYGISEIFALELLLLLLSQQRAADPVDTPPEDGGRPTEDDEAAETAQAAATLPKSGPSGGRESILSAQLELMRSLPEAQDIPHFWQLFIARMQEAAEVTSLACLDGGRSPDAVYTAGKARSGLQQELLGGDRIQAYFRTLEQIVEIVNMPSSLERARNMLLECGLQWLVPLRGDMGGGTGIAALGLRWHCPLSDPGGELQGIMKIVVEALQRLCEGKRRADMSLGLLEDLLVSEQPAHKTDHVTRETVRAVRLLARELGLSHEQERDLILGALLRNHGLKLASFDDHEADRLTGDDRELYRRHPGQGDRILARLKAPVAVREAVRHHHERFDGQGFPDRLKGRDIPLTARLVALAQCWASHLVGDSGEEEAMASVKREAGLTLDPDLVKIFLKAVRRHELNYAF